MAISKNWSVAVGGQNYDIALEKNRLSVNGQEPVKISKLKSKDSNMLQSVYDVMLGETLAKLVVTNKDARFVVDGKDVETNEDFDFITLPKWVYVFYVLCVVDFFAVVGGAIGGALYLTTAVFISRTAASKKMSNGGKIAACIGIYLAATLLGLAFAIFVVSTLG
ncbi:MAG: hypothetical protein K5773_02265 [Pseudobutyrivibrio sp.]|nr:hypothetical protein [Pseudobutyrivibrio sp.]